MTILLFTALATLSSLVAMTRAAGPDPTPAAGDSAAPGSGPPAAIRLIEETVRERSARVSGDARAGADVVLESSARRVDLAARRRETRIADRLAAEFGIPARELIETRSRLDVSWGQLVIALTLAANTNPAIPFDRLVAVHQDDFDWGQIAAGLGLSLGDAVHAVHDESRVAVGSLRADGRVALIRTEGLPPARPSEPGARDSTHGLVTHVLVGSAASLVRTLR